MSKSNKKGKGIILWSVLTVLFVVLMIASIIGTNIALRSSQAINIFLKTDTYKIVEKGDGTENTTYFESEYASQEELDKFIRETTPETARENCRAVLEYYGAHETGRASEAAAEYICSMLKG